MKKYSRLNEIIRIILLIGALLICVSCEDSTSPGNKFERNPFADRLNWSFASHPFYSDLPKGDINYFMSQDFYAIDVYDDSLLTSSNENDKIAVLRNKLFPAPISNPGSIDNSWSGLMQYLEEPIDLDSLDYIECQILVNADIFPDVPVTMHIDLGLMCEDYFRPGVNPEPDKEDGLLDDNGLMILEDGILDYGEDRGLDRIRTGQPGDDPFDDYDINHIMVNGYEEYPEINGTEGNDRLDTEDLNNDGELNLTNSYIHYTFDLDNTELLHSINSKGLRTYRIPVDIYEVVMDSNMEPDIQNLEYLRIWFEYPEETYVILIALDFVDLESVENTRRIIGSDAIINNRKH
jgi:hypothetical protein